MRIHSIACAAICVVTIASCSSELAERPRATDPGSVAAAEAPYHPPPSYEPDPLLSPVHQRDDKPVTTIYTCPMHPEVRQSRPGQCPKCGMTLVPAKGGGE